MTMRKSGALSRAEVNPNEAELMSTVRTAGRSVKVQICYFPAPLQRRVRTLVNGIAGQLPGWLTSLHVQMGKGEEESVAQCTVQPARSALATNCSR